jgi:NTP pyrophosphatase (non-canonical NTP hydrolase)
MSVIPTNTTAVLQQTTFQKNTLMNLAFGNAKGDKANPDWDALERQYRISKSEMDEIGQAIEDRDFEQLIDGIADVTTTNDGLAHIAGINGDVALQCVYQSNMSKFCATQEEVDATIAKYEALGVVLTVHGEFPAKYVRSAQPQYLKGELIPAGKFLKGVKYQGPDFSAVYAKAD